LCFFLDIDGILIGCSWWFYGGSQDFCMISWGICGIIGS
jgi:hypothetical protein